MKVLIWIGCVFGYGLVSAFIVELGIVPGAVPTVLLFGLMWWAATTLCTKWDERCLRKRAQAQGVAPIDIACAEVYPVVFDECEANRCMVSELKKILNRFRRDGKINAVQQVFLLEEYSRPGHYTPPAERKPIQKEQPVIPQTKPRIRFCRYCGRELLEDSAFCRFCGKRL